MKSSPTPARPKRPEIRSVALVVKRTSYQVLVEEKKDPRHLRLVKRHDPSIMPMLASHWDHKKAVELVKTALSHHKVKVTLIAHAHSPFDASRFDLVITVGGDGTFLGASHSVGTTPILGINSSPSYSVGFFCAGRSTNAVQIISRALRGTLGLCPLTRMKVSLNGKPVATRILNDALFCHAHPAATSRYTLKTKRAQEAQKSSGFWIGPAAGSTAAQRSAGGRVLPLSSQKLQLVVREPYTPLGERTRIRHLFLEPGESLEVISRMPDSRLFVDGPDSSVVVSFGDRLTFEHADEPLMLVGRPQR